MIDQKQSSATVRPTCNDALVLMRNAIEILDFVDCSPEIGAHVDLAMARLQEWMLAVELLGIETQRPGRELANAA